MHRFASEFIGKKVLLRREGAFAGLVEEVVVNPENGDFLGFVVRIPHKKKIQKVLPEKEVMGINREFILVQGLDSLGDLNEIVRIKKARDQKVSIEKNKVYTISNVYLGRVSDYTLDLITAKLSRIYVHPRGIGKITGGHCIDAKRIVSIKKKRITVDDASVKVGNKAGLKAGIPVKNECN
jgi:sporulation protein YlmC with PRC-barrel domain